MKKWALLILLILLLPIGFARVVEVKDVDGPAEGVVVGDRDGATYYALVGDNIIASSNEGTVSYNHKDRVGSIIRTSNGVVDGSKTLPFGQELATPAYRFTFTEKELDKSGLHYYGARYYDSKMGRFISPDPVLGNQPFAYANNNPLKYVDPTGMQSEEKKNSFRIEGLDSVADAAAIRQTRGFFSVLPAASIFTHYAILPNPVTIRFMDVSDGRIAAGARGFDLMIVSRINLASSGVDSTQTPPVEYFGVGTLGYMHLIHEFSHVLTNYGMENDGSIQYLEKRFPLFMALRGANKVEIPEGVSSEEYFTQLIDETNAAFDMKLSEETTARIDERRGMHWLILESGYYNQMYANADEKKLQKLYEWTVGISRGGEAKEKAYYEGQREVYLNLIESERERTEGE